MPKSGKCPGRLPEPVSQTTKRCEERLKMRLSTAAWLKPWLLDLKKVIRRRCEKPPRLGCAACQGWLAWETSVTVVSSSRWSLSDGLRYAM